MIPTPKEELLIPLEEESIENKMTSEEGCSEGNVVLRCTCTQEMEFGILYGENSKEGTKVYNYLQHIFRET